MSVACASGASRTPPRATTPASRVVPVYTDTAQFRASAQAVVNSFAARIAEARGSVLGEAPTIQIRNAPQLIFFSASSNQIVVPWWETTPTEMRAVFGRFSGGDDADAEYLFRAFFNRFLIAHEAGHWFQARANRREPTLYDNENVANRLAVAFWRTQPDGESFLAELERLATRTAAALPDPTPAGEDPVAYFGANYQTLGREPLKYGFYQFRFMRDALRDRSHLDFARMVTGDRRQDN